LLELEVGAEPVEEARAAPEYQRDDVQLEVVDEPQARNWLMTLAPPPMTMSFPAAAARARARADSIPSFSRL
jgi:hypothetical protein